MPVKFPTIPVPTLELESVHKAILALKETVEMLTGFDSKSMTGTSADRFAPHVFYQLEEPLALHIGDFWLRPADSYTLSMWNGSDWLLIAVLPGATAGAASGLFQSASGFMSMTPAAVTVGVYAYTQVGWTASRWNIDDCFDTYVFRPPSAGFWEISFQVGVNWPARDPIEVYVGHQEAHICLNGSAPASTVAVAATGHAIFNGPVRMTTQVRWAGNLAVGDEISFWLLAGSDPVTINTTDFYNYAYAFKYANAPVAPAAFQLARKYFTRPAVGHRRSR